MGDAAKAFGLFVSAVEGQPVSRFGTAGTGAFIGAARDPDDPRKLRYDTDAVIGIPRAEADLYAREYRRLIAEGALIERSADDWQAYERKTTERTRAERQRKTDEHAKALPAAKDESK